jgi:hypothetical protein
VTIGPVITDHNYWDFLEQGQRGFLGMFESAADRQETKTFADLGIPLIKEPDWDDIIEQLESEGATLPQLCKDLKLPCLDQNGTNYCWINAPTHCCEIVRLGETGQVFSYSPASVGAPIKGFRNVGGWGSQALVYLRENGINLTEDWPANKISRSYYTDENQTKKKLHLIVEYFNLESWEERASCILAGIPTADGYSWWSHEVCGVGIVKKSHDLVIRNSWGMDWGDQGFGTLKGNRKYATDSVAITAMRPV